MSRAIDERTAWALVQAVAPGSAASGPARIALEGDPDAWLEVDAAGSWTASAAVGPQARDVLDIYLPVRVAADVVVGQLGQSLDGRIATEAGASHYVTGPADIERLHRLRALVDAVIVGAATVAKDDPRLTVRLVDGPDPVRVVLDPSWRLDAGLRVFEGGGSPTLVVRRAAAAAKDSAPARPTAARPLVAAAGGASAPEEIHVRWTDPAGLDLVDLLGQLRARGLRRILVEGGGVTVSRFLEAGLLDRLHLTVAPMLIGSGRPSISLPPIAVLDDALRPSSRRFSLGEDVLFDLDLRARRPAR